jgi:hypothetical protein
MRRSSIGSMQSWKDKNYESKNSIDIGGIAIGNDR